MILFDSQHRPSHRSGEHELIVPPRLESKTALLEFLKEALRLPDYFGYNWDALNDCLADIAEGAEKFVLVHHDLPLESEPEEQRIYLDIAGHAAAATDRLDLVFPEAFRARISGIVRRS
jgi:RNAse (barnase) inhibitor barstar